jgi:hypothetical protein
MLLLVIFSCKSHTASSAVQIGIVNSSANTIASGNNVRLNAQANCEA